MARGRCPLGPPYAGFVNFGTARRAMPLGPPLRRHRLFRSGILSLVVYISSAFGLGGQSIIFDLWFFLLFCSLIQLLLKIWIIICLINTVLNCIFINICSQYFSVFMFAVYNNQLFYTKKCLNYQFVIVLMKEKLCWFSFPIATLVSLWQLICLFATSPGCAVVSAQVTT